MDKGCSISNLVELQQKAGGDGSGGFGSQDNINDGGTGASGDERWCPAAGGAGHRVVAGGIGVRDDRLGDGVGDGGGDVGDGGGGSGGGGGAEELDGELVWARVHGVGHDTRTLMTKDLFSVACEAPRGIHLEIWRL